MVTVLVRMNQSVNKSWHSEGPRLKAVDGSNPRVTEVRAVMMRPRRALQATVMATSIISDMKVIKIWRSNSGHPHLELSVADEYGAVMDLQGCHDCRGCNKAEVML